MRRLGLALVAVALPAACGGDRDASDDRVDVTVADSTASGAWIVFSSARTGGGDLYAVQPETGAQLQLVHSLAPEGTPRYDAARGRVVYQRFEADGERATIVADGRDIIADWTAEVAPAWSPSGDWIAWVAVEDGREDLFVARPDGTDARRLTSDAEADRYPAWAPDGNRLVFARQLETGWDLHTIDVTDGPAPIERLTSVAAYVGHPAWSPDGRFIAFDTLIDGQAEIAVLELATGAVRRLTDRPGNDLAPAWSPDGRHVAFGGEPAGTSNWDVWLVDVETLELKRITEDPAWDGAPVFVPDTALDGLRQESR